MILIVSITNLLFSIARTYNTRCVAKEQIGKVMISALFVKVLWVISTSIAVDAAIKMDVAVVSAYIASGLIGDYIAMKI